MLVAGFVASLTACGYGLGGPAGTREAWSGRAVQVEVFENRTVEADAGLLASRSTGQALSARGADGSRGAAAIVRGVVEQLEFTPVAIGGRQRVAIWRADGRLSVRVEDPASGEVLARTTASGNEEYLAGRDLEATEVARRLAVDRLLRRLAEEAVDRLVVKDPSPEVVEPAQDVQESAEAASPGESAVAEP